MARSGKTAQEFIQSSFSPIVAVLCSQRVEAAVSKNNLSFVELLQPFTSFDWEGQFREPNGTVCSVKNWKLIVRDINWKPLPPTEARRQLNNAVLNNYNEKITSLDLEGRKFNVPQTTPWFEAWRESYLEVQFPSDHEFTKHFLSCMLVGSTLDENVIDTFNALNQQFALFQNVAPPKLPKWFNSNVLKSFILLHDASSVPQDKADTLFELIKQNFEANNCFMITINSRSTTDQLLATDHWAPFVKKHFESNNEVNSPMSNVASTPVDQPTGVLSCNPIPGEDENIGAAQETPHPLIVENDSYDNANSLQTHSFSGSSESVSIAGRTLDQSTEVHGAALNVTDIDGLKKFVKDYASKALLPYIERQISALSEVVANRKGVSRSLLSATKRWFGTGKGGSTTGNNSVIYSNDCLELQLRRLGDLWFMCGQWQRAFDTYHTAKREFYADGAWLCYAGALEMAALSAFMAGDANRKTHGYMEESIVTYLNTCRMVQYAVRATLLSALCLSSASLHGEAAKQLIRMTSEDSDLRSAMLLEQAALCFLAGPGSRAMCRKYAFHMVLAGHRFSKAGQKKHAFRCYKQAYQVYEGSGWRLSTDHVQFALGRLSGSLRRARDAALWLSAPLAPHSPQPRAQHLAFLRDFMLAHQQWVDTCEVQRDLATLPLPLLERNDTAVLCAGPLPLSSPGRVPATSVTLSDARAKDPNDAKYWNKMEQMLLQVAKGSVPMIFKPTVNLYTASNDSSPSVPQGEPIQISISLRNPLKVSLVLKDLELLWRFLPSEGSEKPDEWVNNEAAVALGSAIENNVIFGQKIKSVILEGECVETLTFSLTPLQVGQLVIHGVAYKLVCGGEDNNETTSSITISGKLNLEGLGKGKITDSVTSATNKYLQITVIPYAPCLQMTFSETSSEATSGEIRSVDVEFRNVGPVDMKNLHLAVSHPDCIQLMTTDEEGEDFKLLYEEKYRDPPTNIEERMARVIAWREAATRHVRPVTCGGRLASAAAARASLVLRPRRRATTLYLLAYYESDSSPAYRLLRHVFRFNVTEAVEVSALPRRTIAKSGSESIEKMSLAVEVKNVSNEKNADVTVEVLEASLLGRQWKFTDYVTAARNKKDSLLSPREKAHLVLEATRITTFPREGKIDWSSLKIAKGSPDNEASIIDPPYAKFVLEYKNSFVEDEDYFSRDGKVQADGLIQSMLVVRWKVHDQVSGKTALGQHCLWLECFTKATTSERDHIGLEISLDDSDSKTDLLSDKTKNTKDDIVLFNMEHSPQISHNFNQRKLCMIPITINIVNCYGVPVNAFIDMSKKRDQFGELGWAGALSGDAVPPPELGVRVSLAARQTRRVRLSALCVAPGAYVVGSTFAVATCREDTQLVVSHACTNTSLLVVQQAV